MLGVHGTQVLAVDGEDVAVAVAAAAVAGPAGAVESAFVATPLGAMKGEAADSRRGNETGGDKGKRSSLLRPSDLLRFLPYVFMCRVFT